MNIVRIANMLDMAKAKDNKYIRISRSDTAAGSGFIVYIKDRIGTTQRSCGSFVSIKQKNKLNWDKAMKVLEQKVNFYKHDDSDDDFYVYVPESMEACIKEYAPRMSPKAKAKAKAETLSESGTKMVNVFEHLSVFKAALRNIGKVKGSQYLKELSVEFKQIVGEIAAKEADAELEIAKKNERAANLLVMIEMSGMSLSDLNDPKVKWQAAQIKADKNKAKNYQCIVDDGQVINFSSQEKIPHRVQDHLIKHDMRIEQLLVA